MRKAVAVFVAVVKVELNLAHLVALLCGSTFDRNLVVLHEHLCNIVKPSLEVFRLVVFT